MTNKAHIRSTESVGVIECSGSIALAKLLHSLQVDTRARIVGVSAVNANGITTIVIAGSLAEAQHATEFAKLQSGISEAVFFARPDIRAISLLLNSLLIATERVGSAAKTTRVRSVDELHIEEIETWNVHEIRRYVRSLDGFPLKGRNISKATRREMLSLLSKNGALFAESSSPRAYPPITMMPS
ncbi:MAG: hypothetical protein ABI778_02785 [Ignavibacteriota bacterium]